MANFFTDTYNNAINGIASRIASFINDRLGVGYSVLGNYYAGDHRKNLKIKTGQQDDNITQNFVGLAVDRSVSRLFRGGLKFKLPDGATKQQEYLDKLWDLNKKEIILYQAGLHGAVYGTPYFMICPGELIDPYTGEEYPSLVPVDPEIIRIRTAPGDLNDVVEYRIEYKYTRTNAAGALQEVAYRELTTVVHPVRPADGEEVKPENDAEETWLVEEFEQVGGGAWTKISSTPWPYNFPPIIHWKNLPSLKSCYGDSDIDDAINIQDKSNFVVSNTGKIIKFHAHPQTIGTGFSVSDIKKLEGSIETFHAIPSPDARVYNLEMQSDLASSHQFGQSLRQSIFDIVREVDISSMADKIGALTNFGLQILWSDALDKNDTKRQLYGDAIKELNRRLLVLANFDMEQSNPGELQWGNPLPVNIKEELEADKMALEMKIIDRETVAERYLYRYGKKWEDIKKAIDDQATADNANNDNIGASILRNFNRGQVPNNQPVNQSTKALQQ